MLQSVFPMMNFFDERHLDCEALADWLNVWAVRREKVVMMLDLDHARAARSLARESIRLSALQRAAKSDEERVLFEHAWHRLRRRVLTLVDASAREKAMHAPRSARGVSEIRRRVDPVDSAG
jgi:hypothetical protein